MFSKIILFGGLVASLGVGGINAYQQQEENHQLRLENHKMVLFDDDYYSATFDINELNNYVWINLVTLINEQSDSSFVSNYFMYGEQELDLDTFEKDVELSFVNGNTNIGLFLDDDATFYIQVDSDDVTFSYNVRFKVISSFYDDFKQAIELDIQANTQGNMPSASDLFGQITQGVTGFVGSLGQAFTSVVALFWDTTNSTPTFIGLLMLLAIGAGLIYLAIRFVMALVRRLRG